jgi:hypothetical protein
MVRTLLTVDQVCRAMSDMAVLDNVQRMVATNRKMRSGPDKILGSGRSGFRPMLGNYIVG